MKKLLYSAAALSLAFFAASCQQENLEPVETGSNTLTYSVQVPDAIATKANPGSVAGVTELVYEVYRINANGEIGDLAYEDVVTLENGETKWDLELEFVKDQKFQVLFWAQKLGVTAYNTENLRNVTIAKTLNANVDDYAAFAGYDFVTNCVSHKEGKVTLVRPISQIQVGTDAAGLVLGTEGSNKVNISLTSSSMLVKGLPTTYNVANGEVSDDAEEVEYTVNTVPAGKFTANSKEYTYVAQNYVAFAASLGTTVEVDFTVTTSEGDIQHTVSNVPLKPNYRTNIIGNLITENADYSIDLEENWADDDKSMEVIIDGLVKNINGDYEITNEKGLAYAINNLFVDANRVANAATFYVKPGLYDMAQLAIKDITVTSGTLKVYATEAVVTRSAASANVVISGLKNALIGTVAEGATIFFSGITITDFNGADNAAALVNDNNGKVVLAGCDIVNEEGQNTKLVGGKAPVEVEKGEEDSGDLIYTAEQLAAAFADETVESIVLGADIALENVLVFPEGRTATLDLRGWELTIADPEKVATTYVINNHGTLTIKDSYETGAVNARGIYNGYVADGDPVSTAILTIINGTFNAKGTNGGAAVYNYGQVEIKGGKFQSNGGYALNNRTGGVMSVNSADVRGGIYNCGTLAVKESMVYQHLSGNHAIYNWSGYVTIDGGNYDSESGNELIFADGQNASVIIIGGEFHKTAKSWLYAAATGKDISFVVNGGTHYGYVNTPEMSVDTFRPYGDPIVVKGGSYNFDANKWCHKDYKAVKNAETAMWDIVKKVYVAQIGEEKYESIQEAFNAGGEISLIKDVELNEMLVLDSDKTATLDLNGFAITVPEAIDGRSIYALNNKGTLTIKDSKGNGSISARGIYNGYNGVSSDETVEGAKLIIENGNFYALDSNGGACILNCAEAIINGGLFDGQVAAVNGRKCANTTINGGTFRSVSNYAVQQNNGGSMTINNATVDRGFGAVGCFAGTVIIKDGTYQPTGKQANTCHVVYVAGSADVSIEGGIFKMNYPEDAVPDSGSAVASYYSGKLSISGGTFYAHFDNVSPVELSSGSTITGGTFYNHSGVPSAHSYITNYIDDKYILNNGVVEKRPVAKIGSTGYGNIDDAVANWTNNSTLTLLSDVTLSDVVKIKSTEARTLDLGTYTMTAASGKHAIEVTCEGRSNASYALTVNADATNPGGIAATGKACIYYSKSGSTKDRPIIRIYNGVFNGSYSINSKSNGNTNCPQIWIYGGVFNANVNLTKNMLRVFGGTFHGWINCTGDTSAYREISGGRFKSWQFMTADALGKFWVGTAKDTYDVGLYVDKDGYLVVGGPVITEAPGDNFEKKEYSKWSSYLKYSSAAEYGLYYEK